MSVFTFISRIISDLVEKSQKEENDTCQTSDVQSVFMSILKAKGLDERDKKAAIIDFIAAGIRTVRREIFFFFKISNFGSLIERRDWKNCNDMQFLKMAFENR